MEDGTAKEVAVKEGSKRSRKPPRPLVHHMSAEALMNAYYKSGLMRPELAKSQKHSDKKNVPRRFASNKTESRMTEQTQNQTHASAKPGVGRTNNQVDETFNMKCAKVGTTGLVVMIASQLSWIGLKRWIG
jgi:hypothetical protein